MKRRCLDCPALITRGSRCAGCERVHQQQRGPSGWARQQANAGIAAMPCVDGPAGCGGAIEVDHVVRLADGGSDDASNKVARCHKHHAAKTAREARR